jgi:predicted nucleic acid-binding protein
VILPTRLILDTGVLLALFNNRDDYHSLAVQGFNALDKAHTRLIAPACVILEVAKRLLFDVSAAAMHTATLAMLETLDILDTTPLIIHDAFELTQSINKWGVTLEDAMIMNTALALNAPVWTLNYRDFGAIKTLEFWTP